MLQERNSHRITFEGDLSLFSNPGNQPFLSSLRMDLRNKRTRGWLYRTVLVGKKMERNGGKEVENL